VKNAGDNSREKVSVCLVEHNPLAAAHLRRLLTTDRTVRVYSPEEIFDAPPAFALPDGQAGAGAPASTQSPPVFILDAATLPTALSKYLRALRLRFPRAPTLVLDNPQPREELCRLLLLGIQGFVAYSEVEEQLLPAVHAVVNGRLWVAPAVLEEFARFSAQLSRARAMKGVPLTRQEKRILDLVQRRLSNKEIGAILNISESTVKFHLGNIFLKLGVRDRQAIHNTDDRPQQTLHPKKLR